MAGVRAPSRRAAATLPAAAAVACQGKGFRPHHIVTTLPAAAAATLPFASLHTMHIKTNPTQPPPTPRNSPLPHATSPLPHATSPYPMQPPPTPNPQTLPCPSSPPSTLHHTALPAAPRTHPSSLCLAHLSPTPHYSYLHIHPPHTHTSTPLIPTYPPPHLAVPLPLACPPQVAPPPSPRPALPRPPVHTHPAWR